MDTQEGHRHFSVECFNQVWALFYKPDRTVEDNQMMREMAHASLYHWLQRDDVAPRNISIGLWQISRVHSMLGDGVSALRYAEQCIEISESSELAPFYLGYAFEAAARAASILNVEEGYRKFMEIAEIQMEKIEDEESKAMLEKDLTELRESRS